MCGIDVIGFSDPTDPQGTASYDLAPPSPAGSDNRSADWYTGPRLATGALAVCATDDVDNRATGRVFQVFAALIGNVDFCFDHLNPTDSRGPSTADAAVGRPRREDEHET